MFQSSDVEPISIELKLYKHFTKSPKRESIYKLCLWMPEEHNCLILTSLHIPNLRYSTHAKKCKPLLHCTESLKPDDIEIFGLSIAGKHNC